MKATALGLLAVCGIGVPVLCWQVGLFPVPAAPAEAAVTARAEVESPFAAPALTVQVQSLEHLRAGIRHLLTLGGDEKSAQRLDRLLAEKIPVKDLAGIDLQRPLGLYVVLGPQPGERQSLFLVPVTDEKAILETLRRREYTVAKTDAVYTVTARNDDTPTARLRFAHGYLYFMMGAGESFELDQLPDPKQLAAARASATVAATLHLDRLPAAVKREVLEQVEDALDGAAPPEGKAAHAFERQALAEAGRRAKQVLEEGAALSFQLQLDPRADQVGAEVLLTGQPGSKLAATITELGQAKSLFAGPAAADTALRLQVHAELPPELRKAFAALVRETVTTTLTNAQADPKRQASAALLKALAPSLEAGEIDSMVNLRGPVNGRQYTLLTGVKLRDGASVAQAFGGLVQQFAEADRKRFQFAVDTVNGVPIGRIDLKDLVGVTRQTLGEQPLYFALRDDLLVLAMGPNGRRALEEVLAARPAPGPVLQLEMSLARLARTLPRDHAALTAILEGTAKGKDSVRLTVEGGTALRARLALSPTLLRLYKQLDQGADTTADPRRKPISK